MSTLSVIGVGDNAVDKYLDMHKMFPGGNTVNFAVYAKRAGHNTSYLGWLSSGREGKLILDSLAAEGVETTRCRIVDGANAYCEVKLEGTDRVFVGYDGGVCQQIALTDDDLRHISGFDLAHTTIYSFIERDLAKLSAAAHTLSFDFSNDWNKDYLTKTLPYVQLAFLSYSKGSAQEVEEMIRWVYTQGVRVVVVTQGQRGAVAFDGWRIYRQAIVPANVVDTLGAGDAFASCFSTAYLDGGSIEDTLAKAAQLAATTCTYYGAWGYGVDLNA
jgi:fructoselysine 6-kinase